MQKLIRYLKHVIPVITFFLGSGVVWKYMDHKHKQDILDLEKQVYSLEKEKADREAIYNEKNMQINITKTCIELREKKEKYLVHIIELSKEYQKARDQNLRLSTPQLNNSILQIKRQLCILAENCQEIENRLANIERRKAIKLHLDFIPPSPPGSDRNAQPGT